MKHRWTPLPRRFAVQIAALLLFAGILEAQQLPRSVAVGSNPPGSLFYVLASGLAKFDKAT
ncbi:MAG: hypothetical protein ACREQV_17380 [Candidatus Binatia bacterium]